MLLAPLIMLFQIAGDVPVAPLEIPAQAPREAIAIDPPAPELTFDEARLEQCIATASRDPASAIAEASEWAAGAAGALAAYPQQCLGHAYTALLRWDAAERAFLTARETLGEAESHWRARLAVQAANAALAENRGDAALFDLDLAAKDLADSDPALGAVIATDRARALVAGGRESEAVPVLEQARTLDPQSPYPWLLSATLARRLGDLEAAQGFIATAAQLAPAYPEIGLEAGIIAMLAGDEAAARASWQSVVDLAPNEDAAVSARAYLAQLDALAE